jgi:hypothetical protein
MPQRRASPSFDETTTKNGKSQHRPHGATWNTRNTTGRRHDGTGIADLRGKAPRERAELIIENWAHPSYRPQLRAYLEAACAECGLVQTPHLLGDCFSFHRRFLKTGTMLAHTAEN